MVLRATIRPSHVLTIPICAAPGERTSFAGPATPMRPVASDGADSGDHRHARYPALAQPWPALETAASASTRQQQALSLKIGVAAARTSAPREDQHGGPLDQER